MVHATTFLAYSKDHVFFPKVNIYDTYYMMSSFQNLLYFSLCLMTCDHVI